MWAEPSWGILIHAWANGQPACSFNQTTKRPWGPSALQSPERESNLEGRGLPSPSDGQPCRRRLLPGQASPGIPPVRKIEPPSGLRSRRPSNSLTLLPSQGTTAPESEGRQSPFHSVLTWRYQREIAVRFSRPDPSVQTVSPARFLRCCRRKRLML